jgi:hypothetical protein
MTVREMQGAIGQSVYFTSSEGFKFACWVKDVKIGYGQPRFLITPMAGSGEKWVQFSSIESIQSGEVSRLSKTTEVSRRI